MSVRPCTVSGHCLHSRNSRDHGLLGWRRLIGLVLFPILFVIRRLLVTRTSGTEPRPATSWKNSLSPRHWNGNCRCSAFCRGMQLINVVTGGSLQPGYQGFLRGSIPPFARSCRASESISSPTPASQVPWVAPRPGSMPCTPRPSTDWAKECRYRHASPTVSSRLSSIARDSF